MNRMTENKLILVIRPTRLDELVAKYNTLQQAQFYVEHLGADFSDYVREHQQYRLAVQQTEEALGRLGRVQVLDRRFLPNFVFGKQDTIVVLGQDGLVANSMKYLNGQSVIGVNPDKARWDGVLLPFGVEDLQSIVPESWAKRRPIKEVTMAKATLNNGAQMYAVNDLFIGPKSHTSARYTIRIGEREEQQSSSGIIVSTGLGSTGWLKSILTGSAAITGGHAAPSQPKPIAWDADYLVYSVREPFPSRTTGASIVSGRVTPAAAMNLVSLMPENGVIFSDGIENDFLEFNSGVHATIGVAEKRGHLVM
jgi:NAD kinase